MSVEDMDTGKASRAEPEIREAMAGQEVQEAMAGQGSPWPWLWARPPRQRIYSPPPKFSWGSSPLVGILEERALGGAQDGWAEPAGLRDGWAEPAGTRDGWAEPAGTRDGWAEPAGTRDGSCVEQPL